MWQAPVVAAGDDPVSDPGGEPAGEGDAGAGDGAGEDPVGVGSGVEGGDGAVVDGLQDRDLAVVAGGGDGVEGGVEHLFAGPGADGAVLVVGVECGGLGMA